MLNCIELIALSSPGAAGRTSCHRSACCANRQIEVPISPEEPIFFCSMCSAPSEQSHCKAGKGLQLQMSLCFCLFVFGGRLSIESFIRDMHVSVAFSHIYVLRYFLLLSY